MFNSVLHIIFPTKCLFPSPILGLNQIYTFVSLRKGPQNCLFGSTRFLKVLPKTLDTHKHTYIKEDNTIAALLPVKQLLKHSAVAE